MLVTLVITHLKLPLESVELSVKLPEMATAHVIQTVGLAYQWASPLSTDFIRTLLLE